MRAESNEWYDVENQPCEDSDATELLLFRWELMKRVPYTTAIKASMKGFVYPGTRKYLPTTATGRA